MASRWCRRRRGRQEQGTVSYTTRETGRDEDMQRGNCDDDRKQNSTCLQLDQSKKTSVFRPGRIEPVSHALCWKHGTCGVPGAKGRTREHA